MTDWVLDASAVLAVILTEAGGDMVRPLIADSLLSAVNLAEVTTRLLDLGFPSAKIDSRLERLRFTVVPFDEGLALSAGLLRVQTRHLGPPSATVPVSPWPNGRGFPFSRGIAHGPGWT